MKKVGCCYHPKLPNDLGRHVAEELVAIAAKHVEDTWVASAWDEEATRQHMPDTELLLCVGGAGTVLRAARLGVISDALLLGVNMGRLGFLTELDSATAKERLPDIIARRRGNAARYRQCLDPTHIFAPPCAADEFNSFHTFVVQLDRRDQLRAHLATRGIGTAIHYPIPIHLQPAAAELGYQPGAFPAAERQAARILTLPIHQNLTPADIDHVVHAVNGFYGVARAA